MRRGTATVELILVFSISSLLLFSILEIGLLVNAKILLTTAAREGARRAAVDGGASPAAMSRIQEILESGGVFDESTTVVIVPKVASFGSSVNVQIEHAYKVRSAAVRAVVGQSIPLRAEVVSRSEKVR